MASSPVRSLLRSDKACDLQQVFPSMFRQRECGGVRKGTPHTAPTHVHVGVVKHPAGKWDSHFYDVESCHSTQKTHIPHKIIELKHRILQKPQQYLSIKIRQNMQRQQKQVTYTTNTKPPPSRLQTSLQT